MRIVILGGTRWLGRHVAAAAVRAGHEVTCVARSADVPPGAGLLRADRDRDDALAPIADDRWDAVVDLASDPAHVRRGVRDLRPVAGRYVLVSTASVYASQAEIGADEDAPRLRPLDVGSPPGPEDYGAAKVACEDAVVGGFGPDRAVVVRPGLIGGPGDATGRTGWWPWRFARPARGASGTDRNGEVLVPDAVDLPTAVVDVRDLATWLVRCAEGHAAGIFDVAGEPLALPAHLAAAAAVSRAETGASATPVPADGAWLAAHDVSPWAGPRSLPLWLPDRSWYGMSARSRRRALEAGLRLRPLEETLTDSLQWELEQPAHPHGAGLTGGDERSLLATLG